MRAPVLYADATSVFVQIPAETALGPASVQVIGNCDPAPDDPQEVRSNTAMFEIASVQPVLLQVSESVQGAVAVHEDFSLVASEPETPAATEMSTPAEGDAQADASGPAMSPAVPGDIVTVFGTGFGSTDPALASGEIPALSHVLAAESVQLMLGETMIPDDHIVFAGATPDVVGLYQLSAKIPDAMPAGDFAVSLMVDMQSSPVGPMITIGMADATVACVADLVLNVGESCSGSVSALGNTYTGVFEVEEAQACVTVEGLPVGPFCEEETLNPLGLGLLIAEKQDDGTWKIIKFGDD